MRFEGDAVTDNAAKVQALNAQLLAQGRAQGLTGQALSTFIRNGLNAAVSSGSIKPTNVYEVSHAATSAQNKIKPAYLIGAAVVIGAFILMKKRKGGKR